WRQWQSDQTAATRRALSDAQLLAAQVDDYIGNLDNLLNGLSRGVSSDPADIKKNDAMLQQVRRELPGLISNVLVFALDGSNIGASSDGLRPYAGDREFFRQIVAGQRLSISEVIRARATGQLVVTIARPVEDHAGRLRAVIAVGTVLERFQDALRVQGLPAGSVVRIISDNGTVIAQSVDGRRWIGRNISKSASVARHLAKKEISELVVWPDGIERITGSSMAHTAPWLISVGLPPDIAFAAVAARLA